MKFELDGLVADLARVDAELTDPSIYSDPAKLKELMQRKKSLEPTLALYREYKLSHENLIEAKNILATESEADMLEMAKSEIITSEQKIEQLEEKLRIALLPKDPNDDRNVIVEVRAGTGGEEAALFAGEISMAYRRFAEEEGYGIEILDATESET
jgi:peptide chain release factor 1